MLNTVLIISFKADKQEYLRNQLGFVLPLALAGVSHPLLEHLSCHEITNQHLTIYKHSHTNITDLNWSE